MVAVSPVPVDIAFTIQPVHPIARAAKIFWQWFAQFCGRLPGEYTVAKLDAFDRFRREISLWQLTAILVLSPLPCLLVNVIVESIPLADPATGFHGSLHFQIRNFFVGTTVMMTLLTTKVSCLSRLTAQSWNFIIGTSLALAGVAIATNAAIAIVADVFPVPFTQFAPAGPMGAIGALINWRFLETPENRVRLQRLDRWLAMDLAPILIYPIFTAAFMAFKPQQQLWLSLLLPVLKLILRYLLWLVIKDELDLVGAAKCSVGHLYHILFTVMCLQNAKSLETYVAVVTVNIIQMLLNLTRNSRLKNIKNRSSRRRSLPSTNRSSKYLNEILPWRSASVTVAQPLVSPFTKKSDGCRRRSRKTHGPLTGKTGKREEFVRRFTSALHQAEIVLLRSYITIFVMPFYGIYQTLLFVLPNRKYFATMATTTTFDDVASMMYRMLFMCSLELVFMVVYMALISRQLNVSAIHNLAFVLWSQHIEFSQGPVRLLSRLTKSLSRWFRLIFGRLPGEYTVAKLDAFDCFRRETTPAQVAAILFLTPMSSILINFIIESIPLNDPATGFRGCLPFLLRNFVTATIVTMVPFRIKPDCISELSIPSWKLALGFGILLGTVSTGTIAALIYIIKDFPVPSSQFSPMIPMGIIGRLIETKILQKPEVKPRLAKIDLWLGMVVVPIFIYPISTAFFMALEPRHQFWFSLVLPVIKHLVRYLLWVAARDDLDLVGSVVCAIGHFYHILFTAMCLQNAKNLKTLIAVVIVNLIHMIFNCREIVKDAYKIKSQLQDLCSTETHDIVSTALNIAQKERVSRSLHHKHPSRFSSQYRIYVVRRHMILFLLH
ncbi:hypothetical protein PHMEG_0007174 [Phytophthora megakarya]|uniref:Transmembrane protein n=1 Tax=Phytophthora megakarya TaxID=4795 RepID=A0A225WLZ7_9STRA|nr:hypothetical protein PHMEG_0007174 [Phytophthora megakarya]